MSDDGTPNTPAGVRPAPRRGARTRSLNGGVLFGGGLIGILALLFIIIWGKSGVTVASGQVENGIALGAIYALIAIGYTMVYGIIELINFAHGDVFTLSGFYALLVIRAVDSIGGWLHQQSSSVQAVDLVSLATDHGALGFIAAMAIILPCAMIMAGTTGVVIERVAYRRLRNSPRLAPLITAVGMSFLIEGIIFVQAGGSNVNSATNHWIGGGPQSFGGGTRSVGPFTLTPHDVVVMVVVFVAVALMVGLQLFVGYTKLGRAMRATAQDRDAAMLCGININRTISVTFFIGSALAAAGAVVYGLYISQINWQDGFRVGIIAFTAAVLGGIGNILGAGFGGFLIGIIAVFGGQLLGAQWSNSVVFAMLILVLTLRPVGLLGTRVPDRA